MRDENIPSSEAGVQSDAIAETARIISTLGRQDDHAVRTRVGEEWKYLRALAPLTDDVLHRHLNGGPCAGMYLIPAGSTLVKIAVFDLDDHEGTLPWSRMVEVAMSLRLIAARYGMRLLPVRSGGGRGIHLIAAWNEPVSAGDVRAMMKMIVAEAGFRVGDGGIAEGQIEVFPKQDDVAKDGCGSLIALPFARNSVPLDGEMQPANAPIAWNESTAPPTAPPEPPRRSLGTGPKTPIEDVRAALEIIPNDQTTGYEGEKGRPSYISVGMAVHAATGGSDEGRAAWNEWAEKRKDKYRESDVKKRWPTFRPTMTGFGSLVRWAREVQPGWTPPSNDAPFLSEQWLALSFVSEHCDDMRYTAKWGKWHIWQDESGRWSEDVTLRALSLAAESCRRVASAIADLDLKMAISNAAKRAAVISLARENPTIAAVFQQWDGNDEVFNGEAATIDLKSGETYQPRREDYCTKAAATAPKDIPTPIWDKFLKRVTGDDADLERYLQRVAGYCLTGLTTEHVLFFLHGTGANGKSVFINTLRAIWGGYATVAPMETFAESRTDRHPTDLAGLCGARLVIAQETERGRRWAEAKIKSLTGGDPISARFMRQDFFEFTPQFKLLIAGNHKPSLSGVDEAIRRRIHLVPFDVTIPAAERDPELADKLRAEWPGILRWAVKGCLEWRRIGLRPPKKVVDATSEYLSEEDGFSRWRDEKCVVDNTLFGRGDRLWESWRAWAEAGNERAGTRKGFAEAMKAHGHAPSTEKNVRGYVGIELRGYLSSEGNIDEPPF